MKKTHVFALFVAIIIVFLILVAAIDPLRVAVRDFLAGVGGGAFVSLENGWAAIVANPVYMQMHVFIWFIGGIVFAGCLIIADRKGKIPLRSRRKTQPAPPMGAPQTILVTAAPAPTSNAPAQQPGTPTAAAPIPPVDPNKTAGGT
jgi:hypothetical protein